MHQQRLCAAGCSQTPSVIYCIGAGERRALMHLWLQLLRLLQLLSRRPSVPTFLTEEPLQVCRLQLLQLLLLRLCSLLSFCASSALHQNLPHICNFLLACPSRMKLRNHAGVM